MAGRRLSDDDFPGRSSGIPKDQYEAASVDGANKWNQFLFITLPGLKGTIKYVIMITMIQAMKLFTQPYIMTQADQRTPPKLWYITFIHRAFQKGNFGYAAQSQLYSSLLLWQCHC